VAFRAIKNDKGSAEVTSRLVNNIIVGNGVGVSVLNGERASNKVLADHNLYFANKSPNAGLTEDEEAIAGKDPLLFAPRKGDFHLKEGSPAIGAGVAIAEVADDFDGVKRPSGAAPDIGPFQRVMVKDSKPSVFIKPGKTSFDVDEGRTLRLELDAKDPEATSLCSSCLAPAHAWGRHRRVGPDRGHSPRVRARVGPAGGRPTTRTRSCGSPRPAGGRPQACYGAPRRLQCRARQ
jgi:hypothetical protein